MLHPTSIRLVLIPFLLLFYLPGFSQPKLIKTDLRSWLAITKQLPSVKNLSGDLWFSGDKQVALALCSRYKGTYKYGAGNYHAIQFPVDLLSTIINSSFNGTLSIDHSQPMAFMDSSRLRNNADSAFIGSSPLGQSYTGKGVIIGVIDGSLDFRHDDFRRPNGRSRIRYIWDQQTATGTGAPHPYGYGNSWDSSHINNGTCTFPYYGSDFGHGSCVTGIAAGDGSSVQNNPHLQTTYRGIAPESDIIFVRYRNTGFNNALTDAVHYIFSKAQQLGKPCVINTSIGGFYGPHDGSEPFVRVIDSLLLAGPGRALVAAGGNFGNRYFHLSYPLQTDSLITFFRHNSSIAGVYFNLYADTSSFQQAQFAIGCYDRFGNFRGRFPSYFSIPTHYNPPQGYTVLRADTMRSGSTILGIVQSAATLDGSKWNLEFFISQVNATNNLWALQTRGSGTFDLWSGQNEISGTSTIATTWNSPVTPNPLIPITHPAYRFPDTLKTLAGGWQCSDQVITVANYANRAGYRDIDSVYRNLTSSPNFENPGQRLFHSSIGPTRDGRMKPDISATGNTTLCTGDSLLILSYLPNASNRLKIGLGGKHIRNGGTSSASPVVAGLVALLLEKNPSASISQLKSAIENTAGQDMFTGSVPNPYYGHGKVNIFRALIYNPGCTDTTSANYNPAATWDDGSCFSYHWTGTMSSQWHVAQNWHAGNIPNAQQEAVIGTNAQPPVVSADTPVIGALRVSPGGQLTIQSGLRVNGNLTMSGQQDLGNGELILSGATDTIQGNGQIGTLTITGSYLLRYGSSLNIINQFQLPGTFENQGSLILKSTATQTAFLRDYPGNQYIGNLTLERYIQGNQGTRYLSSGVNNRLLSDWADDISIFGANNRDMTTYLNPFPNVSHYIETIPSTNSNKGWFSYTTLSQPLALGKGYGVRFSSLPALIDVTGAGSKGNIATPITRTPSGNASADGWNILGNPYPSPIRWSSLHQANAAVLDSAVYTWASSTLYGGNYAVWNGVIGINGGNDILSSSQGFFVRSTVSSGIVQFSDSMRSYQSQTTFFKSSPPIVRLQIQDDYSADEIAIYQSDYPSPAHKIFPEEADDPSIYWQVPSPLAIHTINQFTDALEIPVGIYIRRSGFYRFSLSTSESYPGKIPFLIDRKINIAYPLNSPTPAMKFDAPYQDSLRFVLSWQDPQYIQPANDIYWTPSAEGFILTGIQGESKVEVMNVEGKIIRRQSITVQQPEVTGLQAPGVYFLHIQTPGEKKILKVIR